MAFLRSRQREKKSQSGGWVRNNYNFYNSTAWRKLASAHKKANPWCVECLKVGKYTPVQVSDHIRSIEKGGQKLAWDNIQSLCHPHHNQKSATIDRKR